MSGDKAGEPVVQKAGREKAPPARTAAGAKSAPRRRLEPEARARMILEGAIAFFAERGFDGQLRDLADMLGVSQALIFTYFGNKQTLLERVYDEVYLARWREDWIDLLKDRTQPLDERLVAFYRDYLTALDEPIWIRIVLYSGLAGNELTHRYVSRRVETILRTIMEELRHAYPSALAGVSEADLYDRVIDLQGSFIYGLVRKHVWRLPVSTDNAQLSSQRVQHFLQGLQGMQPTGPASPRKGRGPVKRKRPEV